MFNYKFELITGPMSCGKTEELLRRLRRAAIAGKKIKVFSLFFYPKSVLKPGLTETGGYDTINPKSEKGVAVWSL